METLSSELEPPQSKLADTIYLSLLSLYPIERLMETVKKHKDEPVFIYTRRDKPELVEVFVDYNREYRYRCDDVLMIPVPKKFAVLEPDKVYFEMTLKANIFLAVQGADKRELHY